MADVHHSFVNYFLPISSSHSLCAQLSGDAVFLTTVISCSCRVSISDNIFQGLVSHEAPACVPAWRQVL